jgi:predicted thioredoxin/glutaredoxin
VYSSIYFRGAIFGLRPAEDAAFLISEGSGAFIFMNKNPEVFTGKTFQDILKDIYDTTVQRRTEVEALMKTLVNLIQNSAQNAAIVAPLLKDLLEVSVKNDEHIVKIATLTQRIISSEVQAGGVRDTELLSEEEKNKLLKEAEQDAIKELHAAVAETESLTSLKKKVAAVSSSSLYA